MGGLSVLVEGPVERVEVEWRGEGKPLRGEAGRRVEEKWMAYMAEAERDGRVLFNGGVTRVVRIGRVGTGGVRLVLGASDYKTFVVTVLRDREWFETHAPEAMARALGNSVLLTHGEEALLGVRSMSTSAYGGRAHLIGGVLDLLGTAELPTGLEGVIGHLRKEMSEEAGVAEREVVGKPRLMAVLQDEFLGQPELVWQWELGVPVEEIARRLDGREHHGWAVVRKGGVSGEIWEQMTPVARGTWERWRQGETGRFTKGSF